MKRIGLIVLVLLSFLLSACGENEQAVLKSQTDALYVEGSDLSTEPQKPIESNQQKEVKRVLDRDIFIFKKDFPEFYTATINMEQTTAYVENWSFSEILNEVNFNNIEWTVSKVENGGNIVAFSGEYVGTVVYVQFYVSDGEEPMALSLYVYYKKEQYGEELLSAQQFMDEYNMGYELALIGVDASISCMLTIMSEAATVPANEYYEAEADQFMINGNYDRAIEYYEKAHITRDKLSAAYYAKAENCLASGDYDSAAIFFSYAGTYKDSQVRTLEVFYKSGEQHEKNKDYDSAIYSYSMAGDYSDAREKYKECNYKQGELYMLNKQYVIAAEYFAFAETYSDARTMVSECYYCYGKQQFDLNYISEAIEYLSKCRGYKDTDEILLSYYYREATFAFDSFLDAFTSGNNNLISQWYGQATKYLGLCEGYKDSNNLLMVINKLYNAKKYLENISPNQYGVFSLNGMTTSVNGNIITLDVPSWTTDASVVCSMVLNYDMNSNTFNATLKNMYAGERITSKKNAKMVESLITLFTDLEQLGDFVTMYSDANKWNSTETEASFSVYYGGYAINIDVALSNSRLTWYISADK